MHNFTKTKHRSTSKKGKVRYALLFVMGLMAGSINLSAQHFSDPVRVSQTAVSYVAHADFNNDGLPDLATATGTTVEILLNSSATPGTFTTFGTYTLPAQIVKVAVGDFNGDNVNDLVVGQTLKNEVRLLNGDPARPGKFLDSYPAATYWHSCTDLAVADFNNDGLSDIHLIPGHGTEVMINSATSPGTFTRTLQWSGANLKTGSIGDFNRDGYLDFTVATASSTSSGGVPVYYFINRQDGSFQYNYGMYMGVPGTHRTVVAWDFNNDGLKDVVSLNDEKANYFPNAGTSPVTFTYGHVSTAYNLVNGHRPAVLDFNYDGFTDIAAASGLSNSEVSLLTNTPAFPGRFTTAFQVVGTGGAFDMVADDFDRDGKTDLMAVTADGLYLLKGSATIASPTTAPTSAAIRDLQSRQAAVDWIKGNSSHTLAVVRRSSSIINKPVNGTAYKASRVFGEGTNLGGGNYVLYSGEDGLSRVTNLLPETEYVIDLYAVNGTGAASKYFLTQHSITLMTPCDPPATPEPASSWQTYIKQGTTGTLTVKNIPEASSYTWTLPSGFTITSGVNTNSITYEASSTAASGNISVVANKTFASGKAFTFFVVTGTKDLATINVDNITRTYGDAEFLPKFTTNGTGLITINEVDDDDDVVSIANNLLTINKAGTARLSISVAADATYGPAIKDFTITVNKKELPVRAKNYTRAMGEENPEFSLVYGKSSAPLGNSLSFDGGNDQIQVPNHPGIANISSEVTVEAWVFSRSQYMNTWVVGNYSGTGFMLAFNAEKFAPFVQDVTGTRKIITAGKVEMNKWTHFAFTYKAGNKMNAYVNGELVGSIDAPNNISTNTNPLYISSWSSSRLIGSLDEVRIWNVARTEEEIKANMNREIEASATGLVSYYKFNQGVAGGANGLANTLIDEKGNTGTLYNFALSGNESNWLKGANPFNGTGFKDGEDAEVINTKPSASTTADINSLPGEYEITVSGGSDNNYRFAYEHGTLKIKKGQATITLADLEVTYTGEPLPVTIATEPANLPVEVLYNDDATVPVNAGTYTVSANIVSDVYNGSATGTLIIKKATQSITLGDVDPKTLGDPAFELPVSSNTDLAITLTASPADKVSISGTQITLLKAGKITFTAKQSGDANHLAAEQQVTMCINPVKPAISTQQNIGSAIELTSSVASNNRWVFNGSSVTNATRQKYLAAEAGQYQVRVNVDGCESVLSDAVTIQSQEINSQAMEDKTIGDGPFELPFSATSGLPLAITAEPDDRVSITDNIVTLVKPGEVTFQIAQTGDGTFLAAEAQQVTICIKPAKPVIQIDQSEAGHPILISNTQDNYQWLVNGTMIEDATGNSLEVEAEGRYSVQVEVDGCMNTSDAVQMFVTGTETNTEAVKVFPNPVNKDLIVDLGEFANGSSLTVINAQGKIVYQAITSSELTHVDFENCATGIYTVLVVYKGRIISKQVIKN